MQASQFEMLSEASLHFIWDDRSRHGVDLVALMMRRGSPYAAELREVRRRRRMRRKAREAYREAKRKGEPTRKRLRKLNKRSRQMEKAIHSYLGVVQEELTRSDFRLTVAVGPPPKRLEKQSFRLESGSPDATYFAARILQRDLVEAFGLRFPGRTDVVKTFVSVLKGKWAKSVVRADIEAFYESVPHCKLLELIDSNHVLSPLSKTWIRHILVAYSVLHPAGADLGVPRGVGPSACLAEAYLTLFDHALKDRPECVFYARYVDDVIAVMAPVDSRDAPVGGYLSAMEAELSHRGLRLSTDPDKRLEAYLEKDSALERCTIRLLGYRIDHSVGSGRVAVDMSDKRRDRMLLRLNRVFDIYERSKSKTGLSAHLLDSRVRLLAGNTRLINSKKDAFAGLRFSNSQLTEGHALQRLDGILAQRIVALEAAGIPAGITSRLRKAGFVRGFEETTFVKFTSSEWRRVASAWRGLA